MSKQENYSEQEMLSKVREAAKIKQVVVMEYPNMHLTRMKK